MALQCEGKTILANGTYMEVQDPATSAWLTVAGLTDFNGPQTTRGEIEVTELCSAAKEYVADLKDNGTFTSTVHTKLGTASQKLLFAGLDARDPYLFRLVLPDDGLGNGPVIISFAAFVTGFPVSGGRGQVISSALSLRITGDVEIQYTGSGQAVIALQPSLLVESAANDGSVPSISLALLENETFTGTSGSALPGVTFTGVPSGLTAEIIRNSDVSASISFSGEADSHAADTTEQVTISFSDASFSGGDASIVVGASNILTIRFV